MAKNDIMTNVSCKNAVEALLFSAGKNMTVDTISQIIGTERGSVLDALAALKDEYNSRDSALMILDEGELWKIHVREKFLPIVQKIVADTELPKSVLETLAVIAFKSPALQSEVINTRSSVAYEHIGLLLDMGFITREKKGRSFSLKVTDKFFDYFDIAGDKSLKELLKSVPEKVAEKEEQAEKDREEGEQKKKIPYQKGIILNIPQSGTIDPDRHKDEVPAKSPVAPEMPQKSKDTPKPTPLSPASEESEEKNEDEESDEEDEVPGLLSRLDKEIDEMTKKKDP
ncbi:MAG: SMC-Scp complex subunit ScpB [Nanoarchaeota archaeon]